MATAERCTSTCVSIEGAPHEGLQALIAVIVLSGIDRLLSDQVGDTRRGIGVQHHQLHAFRRWEFGDPPSFGARNELGHVLERFMYVRTGNDPTSVSRVCQGRMKALGLRLSQ
jgi:hypothetical protein